MSAREALTDEELLRYSGEHLAYEIQMLRGMETLLAAVLNGALMATDILKNGMIESWIVHLRNLIDFLYPSSLQADDVVAADFFDQPDDWEALRLPLSDELDKARQRAHKELAHLTTRRKSRGDPGKEWAFRDLTEEVLDLVGMFAVEASHDRLDQAVRDAVAGRYSGSS